MGDFKVADFLQNFNKTTRRGICRACGEFVVWGKYKLASHKRARCAGITQEDRDFFRIQTGPGTTPSNNNHTSIPSENNSRPAPYVLTAEKKREIDEAIADFFFRTGVSFSVLDSSKFTKLVQLLNPEYGAVMPKSRTLSGVTLNRAFETAKLKVDKKIRDAKCVSICSDGFTNIRGDHMVNSLVKIPTAPSLLLNVINMSGQIQNASAIAQTLTHAIVSCGEEKVVSVVTDNAPVMKASWKILEEKFPSVSAYGCAPHCLNLLVKDILSQSSSGKFFFSKFSFI